MKCAAESENNVGKQNDYIIKKAQELNDKLVTQSNRIGILCMGENYFYDPNELAAFIIYLLGSLSEQDIINSNLLHRFFLLHYSVEIESVGSFYTLLENLNHPKVNKLLTLAKSIAPGIEGVMVNKPTVEQNKYTSLSLCGSEFCHIEKIKVTRKPTRDLPTFAPDHSDKNYAAIFEVFGLTILSHISSALSNTNIRLVHFFLKSVPEKILSEMLSIFESQESLSKTIPIFTSFFNQNNQLFNATILKYPLYILLLTRVSSHTITNNTIKSALESIVEMQSQKLCPFSISLLFNLYTYIDKHSNLSEELKDKIRYYIFNQTLEAYKRDEPAINSLDISLSIRLMPAFSLMTMERIKKLVDEQKQYITYDDIKLAWFNTHRTEIIALNKLSLLLHLNKGYCPSNAHQFRVIVLESALITHGDVIDISELMQITGIVLNEEENKEIVLLECLLTVQNDKLFNMITAHLNLVKPYWIKETIERDSYYMSKAISYRNLKLANILIKQLNNEPNLTQETKNLQATKALEAAAFSEQVDLIKPIYNLIPQSSVYDLVMDAISKYCNFDTINELLKLNPIKLSASDRHLFAVELLAVPAADVLFNFISVTCPDAKKNLIDYLKLEDHEIYTDKHIYISILSYLSKQSNYSKLLEVVSGFEHQLKQSISNYDFQLLKTYQQKAAWCSIFAQSMGYCSNKLANSLLQMTDFKRVINKNIVSILFEHLINNRFPSIDLDIFKITLDNQRLMFDTSDIEKWISVAIQFDDFEVLELILTTTFPNKAVKFDFDSIFSLIGKTNALQSFSTVLKIKSNPRLVGIALNSAAEKNSLLIIRKILTLSQELGLTDEDLYKAFLNAIRFNHLLIIIELLPKIQGVTTIAIDELRKNYVDVFIIAAQKEMLDVMSMFLPLIMDNKNEIIQELDSAMNKEIASILIKHFSLSSHCLDMIKNILENKRLMFDTSDIEKLISVAIQCDNFTVLELILTTTFPNKGVTFDFDYIFSSIGKANALQSFFTVLTIINDPKLVSIAMNSAAEYNSLPLTRKILTLSQELGLTDKDLYKAFLNAICFNHFLIIIELLPKIQGVTTIAIDEIRKSYADVFIKAAEKEMLDIMKMFLPLIMDNKNVIIQALDSAIFYCKMNSIDFLMNLPDLEQGLSKNEALTIAKDILQHRTHVIYQPNFIRVTQYYPELIPEVVKFMKGKLVSKEFINFIWAHILDNNLQEVAELLLIKLSNFSESALFNTFLLEYEKKEWQAPINITGQLLANASRNNLWDIVQKHFILGSDKVANQLLIEVLVRASKLNKDDIVKAYLAQRLDPEVLIEVFVRAIQLNKDDIVEAYFAQRLDPEVLSEIAYTVISFGNLDLYNKYIAPKCDKKTTNIYLESAISQRNLAFVIACINQLDSVDEDILGSAWYLSIESGKIDEHNALIPAYAKLQEPSNKMARQLLMKAVKNGNLDVIDFSLNHIKPNPLTKDDIFIAISEAFKLDFDKIATVLLTLNDDELKLDNKDLLKILVDGCHDRNFSIIHICYHLLATRAKIDEQIVQMLYSQLKNSIFGYYSWGVAIINVARMNACILTLSCYAQPTEITKEVVSNALINAVFNNTNSAHILMTCLEGMPQDPDKNTIIKALVIALQGHDNQGLISYLLSSSKLNKEDIFTIFKAAVMAGDASAVRYFVKSRYLRTYEFVIDKAALLRVLKFALFTDTCGIDVINILLNETDIEQKPDQHSLLRVYNVYLQVFNDPDKINCLLMLKDETKRLPITFAEEHFRNEIMEQEMEIRNKFRMFVDKREKQPVVGLQPSPP